MLFVFILNFLSFSECIQVTPEPQLPSRYHTHQEIGQLFLELAQNYSDFASVYAIGHSVEERELWVLKIKAPNSPILGAPNIKFIGNIHGNEPVGRELILYFAQYVLKNYETDSEVKWILDRAIFHLLPSLNPDGFERSKEGLCYSGPGRENGNFVDLNRSFPDHFKENRVSIQPETLAVAQWMSQVPFVLSASFHGGALVANYPFDSNPENERESLIPSASLTPDDDVFKYLAQVYSNSHLNMHKGKTCNGNQPPIPGGITNGAAWYSLTGGMQDYNYVSQGCMELTLEISCCKYPEAINLPRLWTENKRAMIELAKQSQLGVRGLIVDKLTSAHVAGALLRISDRSIPFFSSKNGEFWRILLPGEYTLIVEAKGYETQSFPFIVENRNITHPTSTWLNIYLKPAEDLIMSASSNMAQTIKNSANLHSLSLSIFLLAHLLYFFISWDMT